MTFKVFYNRKIDPNKGVSENNLDYVETDLDANSWNEALKKALEFENLNELISMEWI